MLELRYLTTKDMCRNRKFLLMLLWGGKQFYLAICLKWNFRLGFLFFPSDSLFFFQMCVFTAKQKHKTVRHDRVAVDEQMEYLSQKLNPHEKKRKRENSLGVSWYSNDGRK